MRRSDGLVLSALLILAMVGGCATQSTSPTPQAAPAPAVTPPPAGSKLAGIREGMTPEQVQKIAGTPASIKPYITSKAFIPWYVGPDRQRAAYYYKGQGRVIFSGEGGFGTDSHVLRVEYDPSDPGAPR
ncbi:MAG TPA: hypothetical protein VJ829_04720 [Candidatus Binatia bacterium]|nr:hypothetical protein [Candidatus Binatia bacterium]